MQVGISKEDDTFYPVFKTCRDMCYGKRPCIRICNRCPRHHLDVIVSGECTKLPKNIGSTLFDSDGGNSKCSDVPGQYNYTKPKTIFFFKNLKLIVQCNRLRLIMINIHFRIQ